MIDTILFDFDGTLMDTTEIIVASWQHTFKTIDGAERPRDEILATFGEVLTDTVKRNWPDMDADEVVEIYRSYQRDKFIDAISLFPGMRELLDELYNSGYAMGIVTARTRYSVVAAMDSYDISKYFGSLVTCDDTDEHKPSPVPAQMVLEELGKSEDNAVIVGDSRYDILCGKNAGIRSVLVGWNSHTDPASVMAEVKPDKYIEKPSRLLEVLKEM